MTRLSELPPTNFDEVVRPATSLCQDFRNKLNAEAFEIRAIDRAPGEMADIVLRKDGAGLKLSEARELPNLILLSEYDPYQPEFAAAVLNNFSANKRFWADS